LNWLFHFDGNEQRKQRHQPAKREQQNELIFHRSLPPVIGWRSLSSRQAEQRRSGL
jgi:hypothetical protein